MNIENINIKIGDKGFLSYYKPSSNFLKEGKQVTVMAMGKKLQLGVYLCCVLSKNGANVIKSEFGCETHPSNKEKDKFIDIGWMKVSFIDNGNFISGLMKNE
jgi:hypothetical protein